MLVNVGVVVGLSVAVLDGVLVGVCVLDGAIVNVSDGITVIVG